MKTADADSRQMRVLYIEDDPTLLSYVIELLADEDINCVGAESAEKGLDLIESFEPDTILLDLTLPGMSGFELLDIFKDRLPDTEIIIVSGTGKDEDLVKCINNGAFRYYPKPINETELISAIKTAAEILRLRRIEQQTLSDLEALVEKRTDQWKQSHRRYLALYNSLNLVFVTDTSGEFTDVNKAACDALGLSVEEILGKQFFDFLHPDSQKGTDPIESDFFQSLLSPSEHLELHLSRKDGSALFVQFKDARIEDSGEYIFVGKDTTESVEAFHSLEENKKHLQELNKRLVDLIQSTNKISKTGQLNKVGQNFLEVFTSNMESEGGSIYHVKDDGLVLLHAIGDRKPIEYIEFPLRDNSIFGIAVNQKIPILVKDIDAENNIKKSGGSYKNNSVLVLPILDDSHAIVTLISLHNKKIPPFTEEDEKIGQILASYTYESIRSAKFSDQLRESEKMYRLLVDNANEGIIVIQDSRVVYMNPKASETFGDRNLVDTKPLLREFILAADLEKVNASMTQMIQEELPPQKAEFRIRQQTGDFLWVDTNNVVIEWESNPAVLVFFSDITKRKEAEMVLRDNHDLLEKKVDERTREIHKTNELLETEILIRKQAAKRLKETEERFRSLVEISSDWIWELNDQGEFTYASPVVKQLLGYEPNEVLGNTPIDLMAPEFFSNIERKTNKTAFLDRIATHRPINSLEQIVRHKDGHSIVLETSAVPLFNEEGKFIGYRGIDRNITDRKKAEAERLRLIEILEATTDLVLIADLDYKILYMNRTAKSIFGVPRYENVEAYTLGQFYPEAMFEQMKNKGISTAISHGSWSSESEILDKNNSEVPVSQVLMAHQSPDSASTYLSAIIRDITHQKQVERELIAARKQAESANQAKSDFLSNISHELRTPMHHILSYSKFGFTKNNIDLKKSVDYFNKIHKSGLGLLGLLNALLDLSKMEAGKTELKMEQQDINTLTLETIDEFQHSIETKNITLNILPPDTKLLTQCDGYKIKEVIRNLISNAIKYSESNDTITISINAITMPTGRRATDKETTPVIQFNIEDEGVGVPEEELETVFDKFVQSSKTRTGAGGTGLGLSISKEIIVAHNGVIWAERSKKGGAIFRFYIPKI